MSRPNLRPSKVLFLVNPYAGRHSYVRDFFRQAHASLWGYSIEVKIPESRESIREICAKLCSLTYAGVFILGGDGTFHQALPGLMESQVPAGVLPGGTANDLACQLGLSWDWELIQTLLNTRHTELLDVIDVNGRPFATMGGCGLGASSIRRFDWFRSLSPITRLGTRMARNQTYSLIAASSIFSDQDLFRNLKITGDSFKDEVRTGCILIANQTMLGGDMTIAPNAKVNDGLFEVVVFLTKSRLGLLTALKELKSKRVPKDILRLQSTFFHIEDAKGRNLPFFGDGELYPESSSYHCVVRKGALNVFCNSSLSSTSFTPDPSTKGDSP